MVSQSPREDELQWFALRDLKRPNAKLPAYKELGEMCVNVFTPMRWVVRKRGERNERKQIPVLQDLLFVHSSLKVIEPIVSNIKTLQFRYSRGGGIVNRSPFWRRRWKGSSEPSTPPTSRNIFSPEN